MDLKISVSGKEESELLISILQLGLFYALEKGVISIEEAEGYLFSPATASQLEQDGLSEAVLALIWEGCELEDVESLIPRKLLTNIIRLKEQVLTNIATIPSPTRPTLKIIE